MIIHSHSEGGYRASELVSGFGEEKNLFESVWVAAVNSIDVEYIYGFVMLGGL
jgi:hypothetical protein